MQNRKARRAHLQAIFQQTHPKLEKAKNGQNATADHAADSSEKHDTGTAIPKGPPTQPDPINPESKPPNPTKKPYPFEGIMKIWEFVKKPE